MRPPAEQARGQVVYSLSVDDIWVGDAIVSGQFWENHPAEGEQAL